MNNAYKMISACVKQLRDAGFPRMHKLQVEMGLLRITRLLLALEDCGTIDYCRRNLGLENFFTDFTRMCRSSDIEAERCKVVVEEMADRLAAVVEAVRKGEIN